MLIIYNNYVYECEGISFSDLDSKKIITEHRVCSINELNLVLEAINDKNKKLDDEAVPDLEETPIEKELNNEDGPLGVSEPQEPESIEPDTSTVPSEPESTPQPPEVEVEPTDTVEPAQPEGGPAEPQTPEEPAEPEIPPTAPKDPPAIAPLKELPPSEKVPDAWLPSKKLSNLYNNFITFFDGKKSINSAGRVIGLNAPGLKQDSKYLEADITAFVQGTEEDPYSVWIKLRRKRPTQDWSFNNPCEVRCNCKAFAYYAANANLRNKSLAGSPAKGKKYRDSSGKTHVINMTLPAPINNPENVPVLCKHLAKVVYELGTRNMISDFNA